MDTSSNTSQDETTSTSTEAQIETLYDVAAFGMAADLSGLNLQLYLDILKYYFYLGERGRGHGRVTPPYKTFTPHVADRLISIWSELGLPIILKRSIAHKLNSFIDKYQREVKHKTVLTTYPAFVQSTKELFYIGKCKCDLKAALCSCELIPENLREFMRDQHTDRKFTIPEVQVEIEEEEPK